MLKYVKVKKQSLGEVIQFFPVTSHLNSLRRITSSLSFFPPPNYESIQIDEEYRHKEGHPSSQSNFVDECISENVRKCSKKIQNGIGKVQKPFAVSSQHLRKMKNIKIGKGFQNIAVAYFTQCLLRLSVDSGFAYLQYQFFHFEVPALYQCERWPCPNKVSTIVPQPLTLFSLKLHFGQL